MAHIVLGLLLHQRILMLLDAPADSLSRILNQKAANSFPAGFQIFFVGFYCALNQTVMLNLVFLEFLLLDRQLAGSGGNLFAAPLDYGILCGRLLHPAAAFLLGTILLIGKAADQFVKLYKFQVIPLGLFQTFQLGLGFSGLLCCFLVLLMRVIIVFTEKFPILRQPALLPFQLLFVPERLFFLCIEALNLPLCPNTV